MDYSVQNLTEVSDCDMLITLSQREKADLEYKKLTAERLAAKFGENSVEIATALQGVEAELQAVDTILGVIAEGPTKEEQITKKTKLEYKKFLLVNRKASYGIVALLEKECDTARLNSEIVEIDAFIAAIQARKLELEAA